MSREHHNISGTPGNEIKSTSKFSTYFSKTQYEHNDMEIATFY